jgi:hypothetical protein
MSNRLDQAGYSGNPQLHFARGSPAQTPPGFPRSCPPIGQHQISYTYNRKRRHLNLYQTHNEANSEGEELAKYFESEKAQCFHQDLPSASRI